MAFNIPNFSQTPQKPAVNSTPWVRPVDWITITDTPGEIHFLVSSLGLGAYAIKTQFNDLETPSLNIDWGDGVVDTITNMNTITYHNYTTGGTACSLGYDTWKIRVYPTTPAATITECKFVSPIVNGITLYPTAASGLLEAYFGDGGTVMPGDVYANLFLGTESTGVNFGSSYCSFTNLQYVKLPDVIPNVTSFISTFAYCYNLQQVVMPESAPNLIYVNTTFLWCVNLQGNIIVPQDAIDIYQLSSAFQNCYSITGITLPPTLSLCDTLQNFANGAYSLSTINLPPLPFCYNYTSAFSNCRSLLSIEIKQFPPTPGSLDLTSMFSNCVSVQQILLPVLPVGYESFAATVNFMFQNCYSLTSMVLPDRLRINTMNGLFSSNHALISVVFPSVVDAVDATQCFLSCYNLQNVTLPTTVGGPITLFNTFSACASLGSITIPSGWTITNLSGTFNQCSNIKNIVLPNNAQDSITTMFQMCSVNFNLETITMPTSLNGLTTISGAFVATYNLQSVVFPSTMNGVTTMATAFQNSGVQSVTLPTSMTSLVTANAIFSGAFNIETITMPATTGLITTLVTAFQYCPKLKTVTLPTTQLTTIAAASFTNVFLGCPSLQTINNLDKLGNPSTSSTVYLSATGFLTFASSFTGTTDLYSKFSKLELQGSATYRSAISGLRLRNTGTGQYAGTSPQIDISYTNLSQAALVQVFNDLPTVTAKTINITDSTGAAALTGPERAIATGKGWTITG
jgi:hypothetical protein